MLEVVIVYRPGGPSGPGSDVECRVAGSRDPASVRAVAVAAVREARAAVDDWRGLDPNIAAMHAADADRLERILGELLPPEGEAAR